MAGLPTLYQYYIQGEIVSGLQTIGTEFHLNKKEFTIYSGALHYFRVPKPYWRDRLKKLRAAGLNTVETYVPWNLHEPEVGKFDFGKGNTDFQEFLDIELFIQTAQEEDLFVIVRPGPYICAEFEFGGLPSWLLREDDVKIRTCDSKYMRHATRYLNALFAILDPLQFTKGGPIIAFQVENEYGNVKEQNKPIDLEYMYELKHLFASKLVEFLFTSDTPSKGNHGCIPDVLMTANFQENATTELNALKQFAPNKPMMVMEYWSGWFDHWGERHQTTDVTKFSQTLNEILSFPSSVNFYMFHGGTTFGFLNGANLNLKPNEGYKPDTNSYDYDAPLSENGNYTEKYNVIAEIIKNNSKIKIFTPEKPVETPCIAWNALEITGEITIHNVISQVTHVNSPTLLAMEDLNINNNNGQSYGYIVYVKNEISLPANSTLEITGKISDCVTVIVNGSLVSAAPTKKDDLTNNFGYWCSNTKTITLNTEALESTTLTLLVENCGRLNYGKLADFATQKKGIFGDVLVNGNAISDWEVAPLEFKRGFLNKLENWEAVTEYNRLPSLFRATLTVTDKKDSFIDMRKWCKGFVALNGFVLSRFFKIGPQQTVYLPGALLRQGDNEIIVFENFAPAKMIEFSDHCIYGN